MTNRNSEGQEGCIGGIIMAILATLGRGCVDDVGRLALRQVDDVGRVAMTRGDDVARLAARQGDDVRRVVVSQGDEAAQLTGHQGDEVIESVAKRGDEAMPLMETEPLSRYLSVDETERIVAQSVQEGFEWANRRAASYSLRESADQAAVVAYDRAVQNLAKSMADELPIQVDGAELRRIASEVDQLGREVAYQAVEQTYKASKVRPHKASVVDGIEKNIADCLLDIGLDTTHEFILLWLEPESEGEPEPTLESCLP
jgi:hypothetical protein